MNLLILMQGPPGSGKSTKVKQLTNDFGSMGLSAVTCSADDYFIENGIYKFDFNKLFLAHKTCKLYCNIAMNNHTNVIFIDNTNIKVSHVTDYKILACEHHYEVLVYRCTGNYNNIHSVPTQVVERMRTEMEDL